MKHSIMAWLSIAFLQSTSAQVGIGTTSPNGKAILDIQSNSKGLLIPRMSTSDRNSIVTPPEGLIVFNTDSKRIEVYSSANFTADAYTPSTFNIGIDVGSSYEAFGPFAGWTIQSRGAGQSFTATGSGMLTAISIQVNFVISASTSNIYELNIYSGVPSPSCGVVSTSSCTNSSFGEPLATSLVSVKSAGINKLRFNAPVTLRAGQVYTFTITPTVATQGFKWDGNDGEYSNGQSFGINGNIMISDQDYYFQTHFLETGWRAL